MSAATFRAAVVRTPGGPDSIEIIDVPLVRPGPGEVRVRIAAAPVNPVDLAVAGGRFHAMGLINQPERTGLGWDFAGTVVATGTGVDLAVGTRVAGVVAGFDRDFGPYAEQLVVQAADLAVVPDGLDLTAASTVPLNGLAAAQIVDLLGDAPTDHNRLLVTGAAGAVGGYVASLAPDRGWQVTGLARAEDEKFVRGLGAAFTTHAEPRLGRGRRRCGSARAGRRPGPRRRDLRREDRAGLLLDVERARQAREARGQGRAEMIHAGMNLSATPLLQ
jgi:NADPH:quinone reductase-like Zn-dependent oxidoreductase